MPELVLYGIRLLAKQFLGTVLEIEVDHSGARAGIPGVYTNVGALRTWIEETINNNGRGGFCQ